MTRHCRAAWPWDNWVTVTVPSQAGGEYAIHLPREQAETMATEILGALLEERQTDADADR